MAIDQDRPNIPEVAVSASAAIGGVASVFAWPRAVYCLWLSRWRACPSPAPRSSRVRGTG